MKPISIVILVALFSIPSGQALAETSDRKPSCPLAKILLSGNWGKLKPGIVGNDQGMRYSETRRSVNQQIAMLILTNEAHDWSIEYQKEDHGSLMVRERLPLKTKDQVKACAQFFSDPQASIDFLTVE